MNDLVKQLETNIQEAEKKIKLLVARKARVKEYKPGFDHAKKEQQRLIDDIDSALLSLQNSRTEMQMKLETATLAYLGSEEADQEPPVVAETT